MDFEDSPDEAAFRLEARDWLAANRLAGWEEALNGDEDLLFEWAKRWQAVKYDAGWACLGWPKAFGGRDASAVDQHIFAQEEGAIGKLSLLFTIGHAMAAPTLMAYASDEQKTRLLPRLARGDEYWCQMFSEPAAGSDLAGVRTKAVRDGDEWVVSGQKVWTSFAHRADWAILLTRSDFDAPKHKGLTYFFVDMKSPGIEVRPIRQMTGDAEFNEVFLDGVRIPDSQRLGAEGEGWRVALTTLMNERANTSGSFAPMIEDMIELASSTDWGEGRAIDHDGVREKIADWYVKSSGLKYAELRTLTALSKGRDPGPESSITKLVAAKNRQDMSSLMLDILDHGGVAWDETAPLGGKFQYEFFRTAANRVEAGTDEVLRNIIAERILGLPPEPRPDKERPFRELL